MAMLKMRKTGWLTHEYFFWHDTGNYAGSHKPGEFLQPGKHPESPETKRRFKSLIDVSSFKHDLIHLEPRKATVEELLVSSAKEAGLIVAVRRIVERKIERDALFLLYI